MIEKTLIELAVKAGSCKMDADGNIISYSLVGLTQLEHFADLASLYEREKCAKICDKLRHENWSHETDDWISGTEACADALRGLGRSNDD